MNALQKDAIYCIILSTVSVALFFILLPFLGKNVAFAAFAIFGLYGLAPFFFYRKSTKKTIIDERDREIGKKAGSFAFGLFWIAFVLTAVLVPFIKGFDSSVSASLILMAVIFGAILINVVRSIRILTLYRQGGTN